MSYAVFTSLAYKQCHLLIYIYIGVLKSDSITNLVVDVYNLTLKYINPQ